MEEPIEQSQLDVKRSEKSNVSIDDDDDGHSTLLSEGDVSISQTQLDRALGDSFGDKKSLSESTRITSNPPNSLEILQSPGKTSSSIQPDLTNVHSRSQSSVDADENSCSDFQREEPSVSDLEQDSDKVSGDANVEVPEKEDSSSSLDQFIKFRHGKDGNSISDSQEEPSNDSNSNVAPSNPEVNEGESNKTNFKRDDQSNISKDPPEGLENNYKSLGDEESMSSSSNESDSSGKSKINHQSAACEITDSNVIDKSESFAAGQVEGNSDKFDSRLPTEGLQTISDFSENRSEISLKTSDKHVEAHTDLTLLNNESDAKASGVSITSQSQETISYQKPDIDSKKRETVEQDLVSLFSDTATSNELEKQNIKDATKKSNGIVMDESSVHTTYNRVGNDNEESNNLLLSEDRADSCRKSDENNSSNELVSPKKEKYFPREKVNSPADEKLKELHRLLVDDPNRQFQNDSNIPVGSDFPCERIDIKEEIESIDSDTSNCFQGFEENEAEVGTWSETFVNNPDICSKSCFVVLERCDLSQPNLGTDLNQSSCMKIVDVESLSAAHQNAKQNKVWTYFKRNDSNLAECKICGKNISYKKIYNLTRHLRIVHDHDNKRPELKKSSRPTINSQSRIKGSVGSIRNRKSSNKVAQSLSRKIPLKNSGKTGNNSSIFGGQPTKFFTFVNSQTAKCKLCSQYMPYRCLDDLNILKTHLNDKHAKKSVPKITNESFGNNIKNKSAKVWKYFKQLTSRTCICQFCSMTLYFRNEYFPKLLGHMYSKHSVNFDTSFSSVKDFAEALVNDKLFLNPDIKLNGNGQSMRKNLEAGRSKENKSKLNSTRNGKVRNSSKTSRRNSSSEEEESHGKDSDERKPRQRTWSHFTKLERGLAQCNECSKTFSYGGGDLNSLTKHLKLCNKNQKSTDHSSQKILKDERNEKPPKTNTDKSRLSNQPLTESQFPKYFSLLRSNNAFCKKCATKIPYKKGDHKSLINHYQKCNSASEKSDSKKKKTVNHVMESESSISGDDSLEDPDFVPNFDEDSDTNKHKTELMAAVELSPKERSVAEIALWNNFRKLNGYMVQCLHCLKKLNYKNGDTWLLDQHMELWHENNSTPIASARNATAAETNLEDIPLLFRLKNQPESYSLNDCFNNKKLQYNEIEIRAYFRKLFNNRIVCKICSKQLFRETSIEMLMSHILQEHVRKLFKPKQNSFSYTETNIEKKRRQTPPNRNSYITSQKKSLINNSNSPQHMFGMHRPPVGAQSTPLIPQKRSTDVSKTIASSSQTLKNVPNKGQLPIVKLDFTWRYFSELSYNSRYRCKICNEQFIGGGILNLGLLSKHLLTKHLKEAIDDETEMKLEENELRKIIVQCSRKRIVDKFSEISDQKMICKICSSHLDNLGFEAMKCHLFSNHKRYLIRILKEVMRIQNYNMRVQIYNREDLRKTKRLLRLHKKRFLKAKCTLCFRLLKYNAGDTKHLSNHLLKSHEKVVGKKSKAIVWKYFSKQSSAKAKCEICLKYISSRIHCSHKIPNLFSLSTGLKRKSNPAQIQKADQLSEPLKKKSNTNTFSWFYFSALKQYNSKCVFCTNPPKDANRICKIACRFNHGIEHINWLWKNDEANQNPVSDDSSLIQTDKTFSLVKMFDESNSKKINSIKMVYSEFSNKYHCNLCSENLSAKHLNFFLYFEHAFETHKDIMKMPNAVLRKSAGSFKDDSRPQSGINSNLENYSDSQTMPKKSKLVKVKLWHHFSVVKPEVAVCNFCNITLRFTAGNVDFLSNHLRVTHLNQLLKLNDASGNTPSRTTPNNSKIVRKSSNTWNYFTENERGAQCKLCAKNFVFNKGSVVSPLTRHLQNVHRFATNRPENQSQLKEPLSSSIESNSNEDHAKWVWQYFDVDNERPGAAKCKKCSNCILAEKNDLLSALQKHLRFVHDMWTVKVGKDLELNKGSKRKADSHIEDSPIVKFQKRVKFNDSVSESRVSEDIEENHLPTVLPAVQNKSGGTQKTEATEKLDQTPNVKDGVKKMDLLQRFQEAEQIKNKKSLVWTYFTKIDGQPDFSRCNLCSKSISSKFGNSILRTHLRVKHNILIVNMNQYPQLKNSVNMQSSSCNNVTSVSSPSSNLVVSANQKKIPSTVNSSDIAGTNSSINKNKLEKNHPVWSYFTNDEKNQGLSKCNLCSVYLSCTSGRSDGLQNHLHVKHNIVFVEADPLKHIDKGTLSASSENPNTTKETSDETSLKSPAATVDDIYQGNIEELVVDGQDNQEYTTSVYTTEDSLMVTDTVETNSDETVHYEVVETTHSTEESTDIVRVISDLLPNYSTGISEDLHATEISPQESELISNIVTSLSNPDAEITKKQEIINSDQLKSLSVLSGETEDTSLTWDFYVKLGDNKAKCDVCSEILTYENKDADNLTDHIQTKHPTELAQYKLSRLDFGDSCIIVVKDAK